MDWFGKDLWATWMALAGVLAVAELLSLELVLLMFALGAAAGGLASLLGGARWVSLTVFGVVTLVLLLLVRPRVTAKIHDGPTLPSGQHGLVGQLAVVSEPVNSLTGRVMIGDQHWTARPLDPSATYAIGDQLLVTAIEGATARVVRKES